MKKWIIGGLLFALTLTTAQAETADPYAASVNTIMQQFMAKTGTPGAAVVLYVNGEPHTYYYGLADSKTETPVTEKTIFELGSISKVMTSILLAQEIDYAKMALTDSVRKYLPDLGPGFEKVTLQELATYTAGLPFQLPATVETAQQADAYLARYQPKSINEEWRYSNLSMGLLGAAIEKETEKEFSNLYRRRILNPLGMVVGTEVSPAMMKYYAVGHDKAGQAVGPSDFGLYPSAWAVKSTGRDMQRFLSAAIGLPGTSPRLFYPIRMTQVVYVKTPDRYQGLGWQIHPLNADSITELASSPEHNDLGPMDVEETYLRPVYSGNTLIDKTGTTNGFKAYIAVIPNKKAGIVVMVNKAVLDGNIINPARRILFKTTKLA